jgi:hypothetical protein
MFNVQCSKFKVPCFPPPLRCGGQAGFGLGVIFQLQITGYMLRMIDIFPITGLTLYNYSAKGDPLLADNFSFLILQLHDV